MAFPDISVSPDGRFAVAGADSGENVGLWLLDLARALRPLVRDSR
jgi:hypothetical protein